MKSGRENELKVAEEAAEWLYRLQDGNTEHLTAFTAWLKQSSRHMREFLMVSAVSRELDAVDLAHAVDVQELIARVPSLPTPLHDEGAIVPIAPAIAFAVPAGRPRVRVRLAAAGVAVLCVVGGALAIWLRTSPSTYSTGIGEQRTVKLDDGSIVYLNARSRLQAHYTLHARELRLEQGEALFVVQHDATRPFCVTAGNAIVRAVGTSFDISTREDGTNVSVVEGKVQISAQSRPSSATATDAANDSTASVRLPLELPASVQLAAGEQAEMARSGAIQIRIRPNIAEVISWRQRRLVFHNDELAHIVAEFNRYNRVPQFSIGTDEVGKRRYNGTFDADDPESLRQLLSREDDLRLESRGDEIVIRGKPERP